ncbi:Uracil phosphoribosyltransferase [Smittium culicis]|uniref:Uracil phosphoribosyltransferase n=1 Tax=Smittium culicis TaxID=133412 RepID=A0A1R1YP89_9FUNG|nr:Uracil phosphoribosyltransferase [Smittium culicis]
MKMNNLQVINHPVLAAKLNRLRDKSIPPYEFRELSRQISTILLTYATSDLNLKPTGTLSSPISSYEGFNISERVAIIPILRSGSVMIDRNQFIYIFEPLYFNSAYKYPHSIDIQI